MARKIDCERALARYEEMLGSLPNVVGLGIVSSEEPVGQAGTSDCAVAVYVGKTMPTEKLPESSRIPRTLSLAGKKGAVLVPIRVIEQGPVQKETLAKETL
jgi:hypothetical protein